MKGIMKKNKTKMSYDVSGIRSHFLASRSCEHFHCTEDHQCIIVPLLFHSNMSNIWCKMFHDQIYHTANRNVPSIWDRLQKKRIENIFVSVHSFCFGSTIVRTCQLFAFTVIRTPWIVATFGYTAMLTSEYQSIRAIVQFWLTVCALPISVTICHVADNTCFCFAWVFLVGFLS